MIWLCAFLLLYILPMVIYLAVYHWISDKLPEEHKNICYESAIPVVNLFAVICIILVVIYAIIDFFVEKLVKLLKGKL